MSDARRKEIIVEVRNEDELRRAIEAGADAVLGDVKPQEGGAKVYRPSAVRVFRIRDQGDVESLVRSVGQGTDAVLVEPEDLRIIALENVIAALQGRNVTLLARARNLQEVEDLAYVLERGVDGIVITPDLLPELKYVRDLIDTPKRLELRPARVKDVVGLGPGERACVDTNSLLRVGEGLLVGNMARMLFLVHNESIGSKMTPPRPFRVNAGSVQCYVLGPGGRTNYLSELRSGSRVLIVSADGSTRIVSVGRVKVERRPLVNVVAEVDGVVGSVALQKAETIRLVSPKGEVLDVTSLSQGDEVLVRLSSGSGRHMGIAVEEFIEEV
jgi:3-dehydroquinate synthase II